MKAIKKITCIQNNTLIIQGLDSFNYKEVEVIIIPMTDKKPGINTKYRFSAFRK
jgi:hypothetical protein